MFNYNKLEVFQLSKDLNVELINWLSNKKLQFSVHDQLYRASLSISLNIAEGSSRFTGPDTRKYFVIARGSAFEVAAAIEILEQCKIISLDDSKKFRTKLQRISKMLYALIRSLE